MLDYKKSYHIPQEWGVVRMQIQTQNKADTVR